ncbi:MAG TPA: chromosomal replication initiator protein DnaA [Actinomycetota bacterium]|nr:chromosomal replication initiator protein DnaA [Actinomycetota bacterium]
MKGRAWMQSSVSEDTPAGSTTEAAAIWERAAQDLRVALSESNFSAWFGRTQAVGLDGDTLVLGVPNHFTKDWIEGRFLEPLVSAVTAAAGRALEVAILADATYSGPDTSPAPAESPSVDVSDATDVTVEDVFHPNYTFDSFVIGSSNRFAHAAALAVAEAPAQAYNPLFIYGGAGLGKTHLLHAIGRYAQQWHPRTVVRYVSTEQFMNDFILALQRRNIPAFHRRYRMADLLLIDDIQFLEGKERTQEEFFHTFNALHPKSQIVITSDRPPKKIPTLEERLRTRFEWGLITDIQPPDLETRLAILQKKAETEQLVVGHEVMSFIASRIQTNIRELEGALIRVAAYASLTRSELSLDLAQQVLRTLLPEAREARVTSDLVVSVAADYYDVTPEEICSSSRSRPLVNARQMAMYLCRELTDLSLPKIGERFGGRDHSTVLYAMHKVRQQMKERQSCYQQVEELTTRIRQQAARG